MWKIGNLSIDNRLVAAPLAGISNPVYRKMCREYGAGLTVSEMISDKALHYNNERTKDMCATFKDEHPVALQLFGADEDTMAEASEYLSANTDCDIIDINMGCPVQKVVKAHSGSYLTLNPEHAAAIAKAVIDHTDRPVTAKIRAGWDSQSINCVEVAKQLEGVGVAAIAVHGRTKKQMYSGQSDNKYIKMVKEAVSIPVIGNGDIRCVEDAERMFEETGCDAVMVGRGLLGKPYFMAELDAHFKGLPYMEPTMEARLDLCMVYAEKLCAYQTEYVGMKMMRGMGAWFLAGMPGAAAYRAKMSYMNTLADLRIILDEYRGILAQYEH